MAKVGDKVVCLIEAVPDHDPPVVVVLEGMTVVALTASGIVLRDSEGEEITVLQEHVWPTLAEAQRALGWTHAVYGRDGPVADGWHHT